MGDEFLSTEEAQKQADYEVYKVWSQNRWMEYDELSQEAQVILLEQFRRCPPRTKSAVRTAVRISLSNYVYNNMGPLTHHHRPIKMSAFGYVREETSEPGEKRGISAWDKCTRDREADTAQTVERRRLIAAVREAIEEARDTEDPETDALLPSVLKYIKPTEAAKRWNCSIKEAYRVIDRVLGKVRQNDKLLRMLCEI